MAKSVTVYEVSQVIGKDMTQKLIEENGYYAKQEKKTPGAANTKDLDCNHD